MERDVVEVVVAVVVATALARGSVGVHAVVDVAIMANKERSNCAGVFVMVFDFRIGSEVKWVGSEWVGSEVSLRFDLACEDDRGAT